MISANDVMKIYETLLSTPGMNEVVKLDLKMSRKQILLLSQVIEAGAAAGQEGNSLLHAMGEESLQDLKEFSRLCLQKAGLSELSERIGQLKVGK